MYKYIYIYSITWNMEQTPGKRGRLFFLCGYSSTWVASKDPWLNICTLAGDILLRWNLDQSLSKVRHVASEASVTEELLSPQLANSTVENSAVTVMTWPDVCWELRDVLAQITQRPCEQHFFIFFPKADL